jgi:hypothetical protein
VSTKQRHWTVLIGASLVLLTGLLFVQEGSASRYAEAQVQSGITSPVAGSSIRGDVAILGTADAQPFQKYELHYKLEPGEDDAFVYFAGNITPVVDGELGVWHTDSLPSGIYTLRLRVVKIDGNYAEYTVGNLMVNQGLSTSSIPASAAVSPLATPGPVEEAPAASEAASAAARTEASSIEQELNSSGALSVLLAGDEDADALRTFVRHLLAAYGPHSGAITATVGALPAVMPIDVPLPSEARVIGSLMQSGDYENIQVFLTSNEPIDELVETVDQQLQEQGFTPPPSEPQGGGGQVFLSNAPPMSNIFCSPDNQVYLTLGTTTLSGEPAVLRISANRVIDLWGPCSAITYSGDAGLFEVLPQLTPPPETEVQSVGGGGSGDSVSGEAELVSALPVMELADHYAMQLEAAGWERLAESATGDLAWSGWSFADEQGNPWTATLYFVRQGGAEDEYLAELRAKLS